jgi:hypothetical protein
MLGAGQTREAGRGRVSRGDVVGGGDGGAARHRGASRSTTIAAQVGL